MALPIQAYSQVGRETQDPQVPQTTAAEETDHDQFVPLDIETQRLKADAQGYTQETHAKHDVLLSLCLAREDVGVEA